MSNQPNHPTGDDRTPSAGTDEPKPSVAEALHAELAARLAERDELDARIREVFEAMDAEGVDPPDADDPVAEEESRLRQEAADAENRYKRALADFQNFRRRSVENEAEARRQGAIAIIETIIPSLDNFRMALDFDPENTPGAAILDGVRFIRSDLMTQLSRAGLSEILAEPGAEFDHDLHAAVNDEPSDDVEPGRVLRQLRSGYRLNDRVIRTAQVVVARSPAADGDADNHQPNNTPGESQEQDDTDANL